MKTIWSSAVFYGGSQPDFNKLKSKGWVHPAGFHDGEVLKNALTKDFKSLRFQVVRHDFGNNNLDKAEHTTYTEIYIHDSVQYDKPILKGNGIPFTTGDFIVAVLWLEDELT